MNDGLRQTYMPCMADDIRGATGFPPLTLPEGCTSAAGQHFSVLTTDLSKEGVW